MNYISLFIAAMMTLLVVVFVISLFVAIIFNVKAAEKYRHRLAKRVESLRLNKMLTALGIDVDAWLHSENILDVKRQMSRCSECGNTEQCDETLSGSKVDAADIGFCNNEKELQKIIEKQAKAVQASD